MDGKGWFDMAGNHSGALLNCHRVSHIHAVRVAKGKIQIRSFDSTGIYTPVFFDSESIQCSILDLPASIFHYD